MTDPGHDRGRPAGGGPKVELNDVNIVPSAPVSPELVDTVRRAGVLLLGLADRLDDGRADLPLAVEQLAEPTRDVIVMVARSTEADR